MRTTLTIDDDVLVAAKAIAERDRRAIGQVVSDLARQSLRGPAKAPAYRSGFRLLPSRGKPGAVTLDLVNRLRDEAP